MAFTVYCFGPPVEQSESVCTLVHDLLATFTRGEVATFSIQEIQGPLFYASAWSGSSRAAQRGGMEGIDVWALKCWWASSTLPRTFAFVAMDGNFFAAPRSASKAPSPSFETFVLVCHEQGHVEPGCVYEFITAAWPDWRNRKQWVEPRARCSSLSAVSDQMFQSCVWEGLVDLKKLLPG